MHILFVHDRHDVRAQVGRGTPSGVVLYLSEVSAALKQSGHRLSDLALQDGLATSDRPDQDIYTRPSVSVRRNHVSDDAILELVRRLKPDVIHLHATYFVLGPWMNGALRAIAPTIATLHDITPFCPKKTLLRRDRSICTRRAGLFCMGTGCYRPKSVKYLVKLAVGRKKIAGLGNLDRLIAPSRFIKTVCERNGLNKIETLVLPNFTRFEVKDIAPSKAKTLLFIGRLTKEKGADLLPDICAGLTTELWHLNIVGTGPLEAELSRAFTALGLRDRVTFFGAIEPDELAHFYRTARLVVLPYMMPESFGMAGIEALSFGRPVVGFSSGGMAEWMQDTPGCYRVPRGNPPALAKQIDGLLSDDTGAVQPHLPDKFTLPAHIKGLEDIYNTLQQERMTYA